MALEIRILRDLEIPVTDSLFIVSLKNSIVQCYQVNAEYEGAKNLKGIRAAVHKCAQEHSANYSLDKSKSICYDGESADLHIALLFLSLQEALAPEQSRSCQKW